MATTIDVSAPPTTDRRGALHRAGVVSAAALALAVGWIHVVDQGGLLALKDPAYLGWGFRGLVAAALVCAMLLLTGRERPGWLLAVGVSAGPLLGILLSRSIGLPGATGDIRNWTETLGVAAVVVEASLLAIALTALRSARFAEGRRRRGVAAPR